MNISSPSKSKYLREVEHIKINPHRKTVESNQRAMPDNTVNTGVCKTRRHT